MNWSITATEPGSLLSGDFRLQHDGARLSASCLFRAAGNFPDAQAGLRAELKQTVDAAIAKSKHKARLDDLRQQQSTLKAKIADIDRRLAALTARRTDPSILDMKDIPGELQRIGTEETILQQQRSATVESASIFAPHIEREQKAFDDEVRAAGQQALAQRRQVALDRRRELLRELAEAVSPTLSELCMAEAECGALLSDALLGPLALPPMPGVATPAGLL